MQDLIKYIVEALQESDINALEISQSDVDEYNPASYMIPRYIYGDKLYFANNTTEAFKLIDNFVKTNADEVDNYKKYSNTSKAYQDNEDNGIIYVRTKTLEGYYFDESFINVLKRL